MNVSPKKIGNLRPEEFSINHQKLIDATIETIAKRGLADTTIAQVSKKAMVSQGYANFRFKSKENLLLSSLKFLSDEYKNSWQKIFEDSRLDPVGRVIKIIENDFSSKIANRNKIAVWVSFYSEVKFRPSYLTICQKQDEIYSSQMEKLITEINNITNQNFLSPKEISETYHSMVDGLWQRILFDPKNYSHEFCKALIKKYFKNIYTDEKRFV
tara:strand:+ start:227 stop:865 length:639 start_codon:yes stop_codon:yes gene_type:complete